MQYLYQELQKKKMERDRLERAGKVKYEYDSDEDTEGGTWEHKRRRQEMEKTKKIAEELTQKAGGAHHIGDYLPPEELAKFTSKYQALKTGKSMTVSDYEDFKIAEDNVGFKMLQKFGWTEGKGLGASGSGITAPINMNATSDSHGLGMEKPGELSTNDDEFDVYRKRMMLAYRFRPNPLMQYLYQELQKKKMERDRLERAGKVKYEYDSDEDTEGGTWEHKRRRQEMEKTKKIAEELTQKAGGAHHIGDYLPPEELAKFTSKYQALKTGKSMTVSDYEDFKIAEDNVGFKMLQKFGWTEGKGLGASGSGITAPINMNATSDSHGLGMEKPGELSTNDDEFDVYRKRMMLAYRFRPNPLNNPRRPYY
ncbi:SURP and G-patch domain-containing protein 1-like, partial [Artemia franciscana]|uniref:SURP and G-patch domain-containing protein 1-like n=1 Tax=Artemia franciscana TaxID=6661 RepID=UPI0032DA6738